jgi:hypothetical protein
MSMNDGDAMPTHMRSHFRSGIIVLVLTAFVAFATAGTEPADAAAATSPHHVGIFIPQLGGKGTIRSSAADVIREAQALGVTTLRVEQDVSKPMSEHVRTLRDAKFTLVLTTRDNPTLGPMGKPTVVPAHTATELTAYRDGLSRTLDDVHPALLAVENEEVGSPFVSGTVDDYLAELRASISVGHAHHVPVTNGGITSTTAALLTWQAMVKTGDQARADDFARRAFADSRFHGLLDALLMRPFDAASNPKVAELLDRGSALVAAYRDLPMDFVNFHWYGSDPTVLRQVVEYLQRATHHPAVTHEIGQYTADPQVVIDDLKVLDALHVSWVIWFDADGMPAVGLHDQAGVLRPNGQAFAQAVGSGPEK